MPPLPANSLDGRIDTFTANVKMTANPMQGLRLTASYDRDADLNMIPDTQRDLARAVVQAEMKRTETELQKVRNITP